MLEPPLADFDTACTRMHEHDPATCAPGPGEGAPLYVTHNTKATHCTNCGDDFDEDTSRFLLATRDGDTACRRCCAYLDPPGHRALELLDQIEDAIDSFHDEDLHGLRTYLRGIARGAALLLAQFAGGEHILAATEPDDPNLF